MKNRLYSFLIAALVCLVAVSPLACRPALPPVSDQSPAPTPIPISSSPVMAAEPESAPESTPTTNTSTPPKPEQPEKLPEIMSWLKVDLPSAHDTLLGMDVSKIYLVKNGDKWVHIFYTGTSGPNNSFPVPADIFVAAVEHLENALSLVKKKRLPTEASARDVSEKEIIVEVEMTLNMLKQQIAVTVHSEKEAIEWVEAYKNPATEVSVLYINKDLRIRGIAELYYNYREKLLLSIDTLEYILSYGQPYLAEGLSSG